MFGKNVTTKPDYTSLDLTVKSSFYTIQGEGPFSGQPCVFLRLAGCNLKCWFCDTDFDGGYRAPYGEVLADVLEQLRQHRAHLVVITGGEPMAQNIGPLVNGLLEQGIRVQIETSGSCSAPDLPWDSWLLTVVCSPKTPRLHTDMSRASCWKYVISHGAYSSADGLPTTSYQVLGSDNLVCRPLNQTPVYVMPMDVQDAAVNRRNVEAVKNIGLKHGHIVGLQLHKILGVE